MVFENDGSVYRDQRQQAFELEELASYLINKETHTKLDYGPIPRLQSQTEYKPRPDPTDHKISAATSRNHVI